MIEIQFLMIEKWNGLLFHQDFRMSLKTSLYWYNNDYFIMSILHQYISYFHISVNDLSLFFYKKSREIDMRPLKFSEKFKTRSNWKCKVRMYLMKRNKYQKHSIIHIHKLYVSMQNIIFYFRDVINCGAALWTD